MNKENHLYYEMKNGKYVRSEEQNADYALIPISEYRSFMETYRMLSSNEFKFIPVGEYNGLQNALRIVHDRALQQIDKEKADEHGYTLKFAELKSISNDCDCKAYYVTKETPYSIKIPLEVAASIIKKDLTDYYHFIEFPEFREEDGYPKIIRNSDIIKAVEQMRDKKYQNRDYLLVSSSFGRSFKLFFENIGTTNIIIEIEKYTANLGVGVYQVSYIATAPI